MRKNKKPVEALLIMHLSSLDVYHDMYGSKEAWDMAERIIDAMSSHGGPVIVVDMLWETGHLHDSEAREHVYEHALFPMLDQGTAILIVHDECWESEFSETGEPLGEEEYGYHGYWEEFFQELLPVLNDLNVDRIRIAGFWYDPERNSGCALYTGQWLSGAFDVRYDEEILGRDFPMDSKLDTELQNNAAVPLILRGLAAEAIKAGSWEEFKHDFIIQIKHGLYWHWTNNPNFMIDPSRGPRDMSSMSVGGVSPGTLMITSDIDAWADYGSHNKGRAYAATIDMRDVPRDAYHQVGRGFGNEFMVMDTRRARVIEVLPRKKAFSKDHQQRKYLPKNEKELYEFYVSATTKEPLL